MVRSLPLVLLHGDGERQRPLHLQPSEDDGGLGAGDSQYQQLPSAVESSALQSAERQHHLL